jgi:hypothetical protein
MARQTARETHTKKEDTHQKGGHTPQRVKKRIVHYGFNQGVEELCTEGVEAWPEGGGGVVHGGGVDSCAAGIDSCMERVGACTEGVDSDMKGALVHTEGSGTSVL